MSTWMIVAALVGGGIGGALTQWFIAKLRRDYFAAHALLGLVGLVGIPEDAPDELWDADCARRAYCLADAMIEARRK